MKAQTLSYNGTKTTLTKTSKQSIWNIISSEDVIKTNTPGDLTQEPHYQMERLVKAPGNASNTSSWLHRSLTTLRIDSCHCYSWHLFVLHSHYVLDCNSRELAMYNKQAAKVEKITFCTKNSFGTYLGINLLNISSPEFPKGSGTHRGPRS